METPHTQPAYGSRARTLPAVATAALGTHEGLWVYAPDSEEIAGSGGFFRDLAEAGSPTDSLRGFMAAIGANAGGRLAAAIKETVAQRRPFAFDERIESHGRPHWFRFRGGPHIDADTGEFLVAGAVHDIDDLYQAEDRERASERRYRDLANSLPQIVWMATPDGSVDYLNDRYYELSGMPRNISGDAAWHPVVHADDLPAMHRRWQECVASGRSFAHEFRLRFSTGEYRWYVSQARPALDERGAITRWFGTATDIHEQRKREEHLSWLTSELDHKVRNQLANLICLAEQGAEFATSIEHFRDGLVSRAHTLARTHDLVTSARGLDVSLRSVLLAQLGDGAHRKVTVLGDRTLMLPPHRVSAFAIILNELYENALAHGPLASERGALTVDWHQDERFVLTWTETGSGLTAGIGRDGFGCGLTLADGITKHQLRGELTSAADDGTFTVTIVAPPVNS